MNTNKLRQPYFLYLLSVVSVGSAIIIKGLSNIPSVPTKANLLLIICLAVFANIFVTSAAPSKESIAFEVGTAVSMSLIFLYSPAIAAISAAACSIGVWLYVPKKRSKNKKTVEQLFFNAGMHSIAIFAAGSVYINLLSMRETYSTGWIIATWVIAAILHDQLNFWLLMGIIRLKRGTAVKPYAVWRETLWAVPINILILSVGGGALAYAATHLGLIGIFVFCLPIMLSACAFHLYVNQMEDHLNNLENIVDERTKALQTAMVEKNEYLAVLTHDMKSPLTSIYLNASMLKEYPNLIKQKPHILDSILHSHRTLMGIVSNIVDLEELQETGELPIKKTLFEINTVAEDVLEIINVLADKKNIHCQLIGTDQQIMVLADQQQIERILQNLLTNAVKYTPPQGNIVATISISDCALCFEIQDSGYGIPAEELPFVFDRFHRVSAHKKVAGGTGLGLAITKALVESHNGRIYVSSQVGKGSLFTVHLPILQEPSSQIATIHAHTV